MNHSRCCAKDKGKGPSRGTATRGGVRPAPERSAGAILHPTQIARIETRLAPETQRGRARTDGAPPVASAPVTDRPPTPSPQRPQPDVPPERLLTRDEALAKVQALALRVVADRHWMTDIVVGAGIVSDTGDHTERAGLRQAHPQQPALRVRTACHDRRAGLARHPRLHGRRSARVAARWCAGCHDVVPFFSGAFDDPKFDDVNHPTSQAGITCTVCHAITHVNSTRGNADYTIEEPIHYPFAFSTNKLLAFLNETMVKAKPEFHKKTFLKPLHKTAEFCSTCHKVSIPHELNHYKEFLRGQNHYDTFLLSGVSGHGARRNSRVGVLVAQISVDVVSAKRVLDLAIAGARKDRFAAIDLHVEVQLCGINARSPLRNPLRFRPHPRPARWPVGLRPHR